jgi:hypothetical protein
MFAYIWPLDFSCSGFVVVTFGFLMLMTIGAAQAAGKAVKVAKKVVESETANEVGKSVVESWLRSIFWK